jgi:hypothetical protein
LMLRDAHFQVSDIATVVIAVASGPVLADCLEHRALSA